MLKLMIVDDEPLERLGLRKIIQRDFHNIDLVEDSRNGLEAIENVRKYRPHIILMDISMPEMSGLEAQQEIIKLLPNTKTIILTAHSDFNYAQEAIKKGCFDYLLKPVKPVDLHKAIKKAIAALPSPKNTNYSPDKSDDLDANILKCAIDYIENHYFQEISLNAVAEHVHLNPQYFSRYFKKETGMNFTTYVSKLRIEKAKTFLRQTDKPIYRIAVDLGFSDAAYFTKVFNKFENQTPYQYKMEMKQLY